MMWDALAETTKPRSFRDLLERIGREGNPVDVTEHMAHTHCEGLRSWARPEEVEAAWGEADGARAWATELVRTAVAVVEAASRATVFRFGGKVVLPCSGCCTPYATCSHGTVAVTRWTTNQAAETGLGEGVHRLTRMLEVTTAALSWDAVSTDALAEAIAGELRREGDDPRSALVALLDVVGDAAMAVCPRASHLAIVVLSQCATRRRGATLCALPPNRVLHSVRLLLQDISTRVFNNQCIVEERFGVIELINACPLLHALAEHPRWREHRSIVCEVAVFVPHLVHATHVCDGENDAPLSDYRKLNHPELRRASVLVDFDRDLVERRPMSFAACAFLEILAHFHHKGLQVASHPFPGEGRVADLINSYVDRPQDAEYKGWLADVLGGDRQFRYGIDIAHAIAANLPPPRIPTDALLRGHLERHAQRCALPGCSATSARVDDSAAADARPRPLRICSGSCEGLARYCCPQHQKAHWRIHKRHCARRASPASHRGPASFAPPRRLA